MTIDSRRLVGAVAVPVVAALGGGMAVFSEYDDAPGGMLLGLLLILGAMVLGWRSAAQERWDRGAPSDGGDLRPQMSVEETPAQPAIASAGVCRASLADRPGVRERRHGRCRALTSSGLDYSP